MKQYNNNDEFVKNVIEKGEEAYNKSLPKQIENLHQLINVFKILLFYRVQMALNYQNIQQI